MLAPRKYFNGIKRKWIKPLAIAPRILKQNPGKKNSISRSLAKIQFKPLNNEILDLITHLRKCTSETWK